jgi:hypothetical protein
MMEDEKVAKKFISAIIDEQVRELEPAPQEISSPLSEKKEGAIRNTMCRLDYVARVDTGEGRRTVVIEIQKSKTPLDIVRFRRYIGTQYLSENNIYEENGKTMVRQLYCIYFLGDGLKREKLPVVEIIPQPRNRLTKTNLPDTWKDEEMVYGLNHRSWIVLVPELSRKCSDEVEFLLNVFDQSRQLSYDPHILRIPENDFPDNVRPMIRRLQQATENPEIKNLMSAEDDTLEYFLKSERTIEAKDKALEEHKQEISEYKQEISGYKQEISGYKQDILEYKQEILGYKQALAENTQTIEKMNNNFAEIKQLLQLNMRNGNAGKMN